MLEYIYEVTPVNTDAECPFIPVHDAGNNNEYVNTKKNRHRQFIEAAYARIKDIGTGRFVSSSSTVTNNGGYIQLSRGKNV